MSDERRFYEIPELNARRSAPAVSRNRAPIAEVLAEWLPSSGLALELASGTGEHAIYFAERFPTIEWQPSDIHRDALESITAWREEAALPNVRAPLILDAAAGDWPICSADAVLSINMVHISPWAAALGLLDGAARVLRRAADHVRTLAERRHRDRAEQSCLRRRSETPRSGMGPAPGRGFCRRGRTART